jgi:hypothetical protein
MMGKGGQRRGYTLSILAAGNEDVDNMRDNEFTEVSSPVKEFVYASEMAAKWIQQLGAPPGHAQVGIVLH